MMKVKYYKCPICNSKYKTLNGWGEHMHRFHPDEIPEGYSDSRYFYYTKTGKQNGICRTCKKPTDWNENSQKYNQYCNNPACKQAYVKIAKQRMIDRYGKVHLLNDPDIQRKMIQHRKISGTFRMSDGGKIGYTGKNEKKFLEMLDKMFEWPSADIMSPSPHTYYYDYHNEKDPDIQDDQKFYIPDMYIPSLNAEVEVEQTTSGNQKMMEVYVVKKKQKEEIMRKNPNVNYVKVSDNDFTSFFDFLLKMKEQDPNEEKSMDVASESYLPALESTNPDLDVVKKIEQCANDNNITLKISKSGEWGLPQWEKGGNTLFLVGNCPNITSVVKTLKTCIDTDRYKLKMDSYNTIFLKRKKSVASESYLPANIPDAILEFNKLLNEWFTYGVVYKGKKITDLDDFDFWNNYKSLTTKEFKKYNIGVCWDFVHYEAEWFEKRGYQHEEYYIECVDKDSNFPTHTFLLFTLPGSTKTYYFESSWRLYQGVEEFPSEKSAINTIIGRHVKQYGDCSFGDVVCEKYDAKSKKFEHIGCGDFMILASNHKTHLQLSGDVAVESYTDNFDRLTFLDISKNKDQAVCLLKNKEPAYVKNIEWYNGELILDRNKIIGQVFVGNGNAKDCGFITGIWVDKEYRQKGLGHRLINDAINKYGGVDLIVKKDNHNAIQLYKKCGFRMKQNLDPTKKDMYWMAIDKPALEEANYSKENCYPVYIVLMHSGTLLANMIKKFTNDEFSHACISFNSNLTPLYSFGNKKVGGVDAGFTIQSPASEFFKVKQAKYKVYVMYVNYASYQKMQENMDYFLQNRMTLKYALLDLLKVWRGKPTEDSKKFFCSRFVMAVIGGGRKLDKVASLYKPQDIAELEDISCVNAGDDFSKYDFRITEKNLKKVQKKQFSSIAFEELLNVCGISSIPEDSIAIEGLFSFNKTDEIATTDKIEQWKNLLFRSRELMGDTKGHAKVRLFGPFISVEDGYIIIRGINYQLLKNRIKEYYKDKSVNNIFNPIYDAMSFRRFQKKRIGRSEIKVDYLETPIFFALELTKLFTELGEWYNDRRYLSMAKLTYERTWLKETDQLSTHVETLDTSKIKDVLSVQLLPHQETFIQRYPVLKAQLNLKGYILAFEQGLGKTLTAVALAECLEMDHVYIVCPNTSEMKMVWKSEIKKYIKRYRDEDTFLSEVMICDDKTSLYNENRTKYFIINIESIPKMYPYITKGKNMLVVDESHNFRNLEGKRTKELFELQNRINACDTLAMSGTPIKATPAELSPVLHLIDPTFTDAVASIYKRAFNVHHEIALSLVKSRFGRVMLRETKSILGTSLPPKSEKDLSLTMSGGAKYAVSTVMQLVNDKYDEIFAKGKKEALSLREEFHTYLKKYMPSTYDRVRFDYLESRTAVSDSWPALHEVDIDFMNNAVHDTMNKITDRAEQKRFGFLVKNYLRYNGHCRGIAFGTIMPKYRNECFINLFDENKDILIRMIRESTTKTLIFSQFRKVANHIHQALLDEGIGAVLITGEVKNRLEIVNQFKESDVISVMVATPKTLGVGVTLTEASKVFFFGPPWRHSDYQQCSDRVHRIGQTQPVTIYNVVLDTGDELNLTGRMQDILNWSKRMVGDVVSTEVNKTEDDEFINEVLVANESSTDIATVQDFFDISEEAPADSPIRLSQDIIKNIIEYREGFRFIEAKVKYSIPEGVIIDEHAIQMPKNEEVAFKNAVWSKLGTAVFSHIADPESSANVRFLKVITGGVPHWELISIKKIQKGSTLKYHPHSSDMTFSKDLE